MSRMEYRLAFRESHRERDNGPYGSHLVIDKEWDDAINEYAKEGWTIHSIDYKNNRCMMEREVEDG